MRKSLFAVLSALILQTLCPARSPEKPLHGDWDLKLQQVWQLEDVNGQAWADPSAVLLLGNGKIAVFDPRQGGNTLLSSEGTCIKTFAPRGEGPGEVRRQSFWFNVAGRILIPDMGQVHEYDEDGTWIRTRKVRPAPPPRGFSDPDHMVMLPRTIFETGGAKAACSVMDLRDGGTERELFPVTDLFTGGSAKVGEDVMNIIVPGLSPMLEVAVTPTYMVYGSSHTYQLNLISPEGKPLRSFGLHRSRPFISHDKIAQKLKSRNIPEEQLRQMVHSFPESLVHFTDILVIGDQIWVQNTPQEDTTSTLFFDVFSEQGSYLYRVRAHLPEGSWLRSPFRNHAIAGDKLMAFSESDDGKIHLGSYRIRPPQS